MNLLVKPTHRCNMNCSYCYDRIKRQSIKQDMTLDMVADILDKLPTNTSISSWIWHGGECTLMGSSWLYQANKVIRSKFKNLQLSMQTNGVNLTDDFLDLALEFDMHVGISFDGINHDKTRSNNSSIILNNIKHAIDKGVKFGLITVLDRNNISCIKENIKYYLDNNITSFSFNTIFPKSYYENKIDNVLGMPQYEYVNKLKEYFDFHLFSKDNNSDRSNLNWILLLLGNKKITCNLTDCRYNWLCINPIGEIYPCDEPYDNNYMLDTIYDYDNLLDAYNHKNYEKFSNEIRLRKENCFLTCDYSSICEGGCKHAESIAIYGTAKKITNSYCYMFKNMINHVGNRLLSLSQEDVYKLNNSIFYTLFKDNEADVNILKQTIIKNNPKLITAFLSYKEEKYL